MTEKIKRYMKADIMMALFAVPKKKAGEYYLYRKVGGRILFGDFEEYLSSFGENE